MILSQFNAKKNILETQFVEEVTLKEIVDYIISTKKNKTYPRDLRIKTDAINANFNLTMEDIISIIKENNESLEKYNSITDAILVSDPKNTAIAMLYKDLEKHPKYNFNIFCTNEAAEIWLNNI